MRRKARYDSRLIIVALIRIKAVKKDIETDKEKLHNTAICQQGLLNDMKETISEGDKEMLCEQRVMRTIVKSQKRGRYSSRR